MMTMARKHGLKSQTVQELKASAAGAGQAAAAAKAQERLQTCQLGTPGSSGGWMQCRRPATAIVNVKNGRVWKSVPGCDQCETAYYKRMGRRG